MDDSALRMGIDPPALIWHTIQGIIDIILDKHSSSCGYLAFSSPSATQGLFSKIANTVPTSVRIYILQAQISRRFSLHIITLPVEIGDSHRLLRFGMKKLQRELWTSSLRQLKRNNLTLLNGFYPERYNTTRPIPVLRIQHMNMKANFIDPIRRHKCFRNRSLF